MQVFAWCLLLAAILSLVGIVWSIYHANHQWQDKLCPCRFVDNGECKKIGDFGSCKLIKQINEGFGE